MRNYVRGAMLSVAFAVPSTVMAQTPPPSPPGPPSGPPSGPPARRSGEALAADMGVPFLGRLPVYQPIREGSDTGVPLPNLGRVLGTYNDGLEQFTELGAQVLAISAQDVRWSGVSTNGKPSRNWSSSGSRENHTRPSRYRLLRYDGTWSR